MTARPTRAGSTPVFVSAPAQGTAPTRVLVEVLPRADAERLGGRFVAFRVRRADGGTTPARVSVAVDYSGIRRAFGGDFAARLRLLHVPDCANAAAPGECAAPTSARARNDLVAQQLVANVEAAPDSGTSTAESAYVVTSGASSGAGNYGATPFQASDTWQVGAGSGGFSYTYSVPLPPAVAGPVPDLTLRYSSQTVDGRTAAANSQPSQIGEAWSASPGYVERRFVPCADDGHLSSGDLCWGGLTAYYLHLNGRTAEIVRSTTGGSWRLRDDPAWRVQNFTGASNGDNSGDYWRVTTPDGTEYYFGTGAEPTSGLATNAAWNVPVFGDDPGERCYSTSGFASSYCSSTWRWNVDYVRDTNGNTASLFYAKETNYYARNSTSSTVSSYDRGGYLTRVEYSERKGAEGNQAPSVVNVYVQNRCTSLSTACDTTYPPTPANASRYPDVPLDLMCTSSTYCDATQHGTPTFWSTKRVIEYDTYVLGGAGYTRVSQVMLEHLFPATNEDLDPVLWLNEVTRRGWAASPEVTLPPVRFYGVQLVNRVDNNPAGGVPETRKYRIGNVVTELGAQANVTYGQPHPCNRNALPQWDLNETDCFPQYHKPDGAPAGFGVFNKYLVTQLDVVDLHGHSPTTSTTYTYLDAPAWHHDDALTVPASQQSWSDWRGHGYVSVTEPGPANSTRRTRHRLFRGMHGDKLSGGGTRTVTVGDSEGGSFTDHNWLAGYSLEVARYDHTGTTHLESTLKRYWTLKTVDGPVGTQPHDAYYVRENVSIDKVYDTSPEATGWRRRRVDTAYDTTYGYTLRVHDNGDITVTTDNTCTKTSTSPNATTWLLDVPYETETFAGTCSSTTKIGGSETYYDGNAFAATPTKGNPSIVVSDVQANVEALTALTYDGYGRVTSVTSPNEFNAATPKKATTTYSPATGYPYDGVTVTNQLGHTTTTVYSFAFGAPTQVTDANGNVTTIYLDALGRTTAVRRPLDPPSVAGVEYSYSITQTQSTTYVRTRTLQDDAGTYATSYTYVDGFGRTIEQQSASPYQDPVTNAFTGRIVTATRYDAQGRVAAQTQPMWNSAANGSGLHSPSPNAVPAETRYEYDALGRVVSEAHWRNGEMRWRTLTNHYGTHTRTDYPVRSDVRRFTNALGQLTKVSESLTSGGTADTRYTYDANGHLATITDAANNVYSYTYNWLGWRTSSSDPDQGTSSTGYDLNGNQTSVTDAKNVTLTYTYDAIDRPTTVKRGTDTLASWTYDAATGGVGRPASSSRHYGSDLYTQAVTAYDGRGRPVTMTTTIPKLTNTTSTTFTFGYAYDVADRVKSVTYPAAGALAGETVTTTYNPLGYLSTAAGAQTYLAQTLYTGEGRVERRRLGSSSSPAVERLYYYNDEAKRLSQLTTNVGGSTVENYRFAYNDEGAVTSVFDDTSASQRECYAYDERSRLTRAYTLHSALSCALNTGSDFTGPDPYWIDYAYGVTGNIESHTPHAPGGQSTYVDHVMGAGTAGPHAVTSVGSQAFTYDANGAMATRTAAGSSQTYTWDDLHKLEKVATGSTVNGEFRYDAAGNRLVRIVGNTKTVYLDGMEIQVTGTTVDRTTRYYGNVGVRIAGGADAGLWWQLANHQNSATISVSAANTGTVRRIRYLPYGGHRNSTASLPVDRGFLNKTEDPTGLVQVGARYYDPTIGRFLSTDPLLKPADPRSLNPYVYAWGNPSSMTDPSGLEPHEMADGSYGCGNGWCPPAQDKPNEKTKLATQGRQAQEKRVATALNSIANERKENPATYWHAVYSRCSPWLAGNAGPGGACENEFVALELHYALGGARPRHIVLELLGVYDVKDCLGGSSSACAWVAFDIVTAAAGRAVKAARFADEAAQTRKIDNVDGLPCNCLVAGTKVHTADGEKPIENIEVGDTVWARNFTTGKNELRRVTGLFRKHADQVMTITVAGGSTVTVTEEHPFYVAGLGWVMSGDLKVGDHLAQRDGGSVKIAGITVRAADVTVYNFTVEGDHNYYVTEAQLLVHNCPVAPGGRGYRPGGAAANFDLDELAQMIRGHADADDLTRPSFSEIRSALDRGTGTPLRGQNSYRLDYNGVRVIVNEDLPWRSTAYYPG